MHGQMIESLVAVARAEDQAAALAFELYPVGKMIRWERARGIQQGKILGLSFHHGLRFRVRNILTQKSYWITFYDVIRADGPTAANLYLDALSAANRAAKGGK